MSDKTFPPKFDKSIKYPAIYNLDELDDFDVCIITSLDKAEEYYEFLQQNIDKEKIMMPSILGIKKKIN